MGQYHEPHAVAPLSEEDDSPMSNLDIAKAHGLKTCLDETGNTIVGEIYRAIEALKGEPCLLGIVGGWGDTLNDDDVLAGLIRFNEMGECFIPDVAVRR